MGTGKGRKQKSYNPLANLGDHASAPGRRKVRKIAAEGKENCHPSVGIEEVDDDEPSYSRENVLPFDSRFILEEIGAAVNMPSPSTVRTTCEEVEDSEACHVGRTLPVDSPYCLEEVEGDVLDKEWLAGQEPIDDSDDEVVEDLESGEKDTEAGKKKPKRNRGQMPTLKQVKAALQDLDQILKPRQPSGRRHAPKFDHTTIKRLESMRVFCAYVLEENKEGKKRGWVKASTKVAVVLGYGKEDSKFRGMKKGQMIWDWVIDFIKDREELPITKWRTSGRSLIDDEDFAQEIHAHLQTLGPFFSAADIVQFIDTPDMLARLKRKRTISITTAQRWLKKMGYRWKLDPRGQFVDGHERSDVVSQRTFIFLPNMKKLEPRMRKWGSKDGEDWEPEEGVRPVVVWFHDESTFYAHNRRRLRWVHNGETAKLYAKGEGHSLMVAEFVSADYGWLRSPDGLEAARVLFRCGKGCDRYFDNEDIREQMRKAMEILKKYFPDEDHVFVFDNAKTHTKRVEGSLSALKMPKRPSSKFGVEVNDLSDEGKLQYTLDGKLLKKKVRMNNGRFANGNEQEFYWPDDSSLGELAGQFKGMAKILEEWGHKVPNKAMCGKKFSACPDGSTSCCCRHMMFNEPDFANAKAILEIEAREQGFQVIFLPKFHCELNFIEQCWGDAKRYYRLLPASSKEDDLECNVVESLEQVGLISMRRYANRSLRFMDAYRRGLDGIQAAWASKKYRGHRVLPNTILEELEKAGLSKQSPFFSV